MINPNVLMNVGGTPVDTTPLLTAAEQAEQTRYQALCDVVEKLKGAFILYQGQSDKKEMYSFETLKRRANQEKTTQDKNALLSQDFSQIQSLTWISGELGKNTPHPTLEALPPGMPHYFKNLSILAAPFSNLREFPLEILCLPVIEQIDFSDSQIEKIVALPEADLKYSKSLYYVDLSRTPITKTARGIAQLKKLKEKIQCFIY